MASVLRVFRTSLQVGPGRSVARYNSGSLATQNVMSSIKPEQNPTRRKDATIDFAYAALYGGLTSSRTSQLPASSNASSSSPSPPAPSPSSSPSSYPSSQNARSPFISSMMGTLTGQNATGSGYHLTDQAANSVTQTAVETHTTRTWMAGDVYSPHDLGVGQMKAWAPRRQPPKYDLFELMGMNPKKEFHNIPLLTEFVTELGRIQPAKQTGLRRKNQRRLAKAIRRAVGIGLMPSTFHHPEILKMGRNWRGW